MIIFNSPYSCALLACSFCGIIMVIGGIILLYKGTISLSNAPSEEALAVEFKKKLKITTHYPALGIFIIGLLFVFAPLLTGKPKSYNITIRGNAETIREAVSLSIKPQGQKSSLLHKGRIEETFTLGFNTVQIIIGAPGYKNDVRSVQLPSVKEGVFDLGDIKLDKAVDPSQIQKDIIEPRDVVFSPLTDSSNFGGAE